MLIVINCKKDEGKYTLFSASLDLRDSKKNREEKKGRTKSWGRGARSFFLAVFFGVTHDGPIVRGGSRSLLLVHQLLPLRFCLVFVRH